MVLKGADRPAAMGFVVWGWGGGREEGGEREERQSMWLVGGGKGVERERGLLKKGSWRLGDKKADCTVEMLLKGRHRPCCLEPD